MKHCFNWPIWLSVGFQITILNDEMHTNMEAFEGTSFTASPELGFVDDPSLRLTHYTHCQPQVYLHLPLSTNKTQMNIKSCPLDT
jgi:hypothetical protein